MRKAGSAATVGGLSAAMAAFVRSYVAAGGWREGRLGLLVAVLSGLHPWLVRLRAREIVDRRQAALAAAPRGSPVSALAAAAR